MYKRFGDGLHKLIFFVLFLMTTISVTRIVIYNKTIHGIDFNCSGQAKSVIKTPYVDIYRDILFHINLNKNNNGTITLHGIVNMSKKSFTLSQKINFKYSIGEGNTILITISNDLKNKMDNAPQSALPYFMKDFFTLKKMAKTNYIVYESNGSPFLACKSET